MWYITAVLSKPQARRIVKILFVCEYRISGIMLHLYRRLQKKNLVRVLCLGQTHGLWSSP